MLQALLLGSKLKWLIRRCRGVLVEIIFWEVFIVGKDKFFLFDKQYKADGKTVDGYVFFSENTGTLCALSLNLTADYISGTFSNKPIIMGLPWDEFVKDVGIMYEVIAIKGRKCKLKSISNGFISTLSVDNAANNYIHGTMDFKNARVIKNKNRRYCLAITDKSVLKPFDEVEDTPLSE